LNKEKVIVAKGKIDACVKNMEGFNENESVKFVEGVEAKKECKKTLEITIGESRSKYTAIVSEISKVEVVLRQNKDVVSSLDKQIKNIGELGRFECSECKSIVTKEHVVSKSKEASDKIEGFNKNISDLNKEKVTIQQAVDSVQKQISQIDYEINSASEVFRKITQYRADKTRVADLSNSIKELNKTNEELDGNIKKNTLSKKEYEDKKASIEEKHKKDVVELNKQLNTLLAQYKNYEPEVNATLEKIKCLSSKNEDIAKKKNELNSQIGSLSKDLEFVNENAKKIDGFKSSLTTLEREMKRLMVLEGVYGLDGIQTKIVQKYLPLLNTYIKEFINILTSGKMSIEIIINERSQVDIAIRGGTAGDFPMLSGGEKVLVKLAVSIGLGLLAFSRCATKPEIIMLDEVLGSLDNDHTGAVFKMLCALKDRFSRVIVISHKPQINEIIDRKILIEKPSSDYGMSEIKRINLR
jgi:DNA repair exonuclease SbcCD ATPase subunit